MSTTPNPHPHNYRQERDHFIAEVNQRMRTQVAWADLSEPFRERFIATMYLAGFGFDDAVEMCDQLTDQFREVLHKMGGEPAKEKCQHDLRELAGGAIFCSKCKKRF